MKGCPTLADMSSSMAAPRAAEERAVIEVEGLERAYRDTIAVSDLHFEVRPGQILGLVGPNGGGKTTTLRAIAGVIPPTRGTLRVAGHDVVKEPVAAKAQLGFVPDDPRLFDVLTVWEHLQFVASAYRVRDAAVEARRLLESSTWPSTGTSWRPSCRGGSARSSRCAAPTSTRPLPCCSTSRSPGSTRVASA
jgi:ABC-type lipopolysaccharide export system ATPase subunit